MSDTQQGPGWWQASDGKWYPPDQQPGPAPGQMPYGATPQQPYGYTQYGYGYGYGPTVTYSGFWRRVAAYFIDSIILAIPSNIISLAFSAGSTGAFSGAGVSLGASLAATLVNMAIAVTYFAYFDGTRGQTVGKMALSIKVIDMDNGDVIGVPRGIGRYFAKLLSGLALGLGFLWMLWDPRKQTWHDKLVRSVVVRTQ